MRYFVQYVIEIALEIQHKCQDMSLLGMLHFLNNRILVGNKSNKQNCNRELNVLILFIFLVSV